MVSNNTNKLRKTSGFTIVELLIVIVVIGILAAITIVAYNGIQNRANATAAEALAVDAVKKAEAYNAVKGVYPTLTELAAVTTDPAEAKLEGKLVGALQTAAPDKSNGKTKILFAACGTGNTGVNVTWWDFTATAIKLKPAGTCP